MKNTYAIVGLLITSLLVLTACNLPFLAKATTAATQAPAVNTQAAPAEATQAPAQQTQAPAQATQPPAAGQPTNTLAPIQHSTIPGDPSFLTTQITIDCNTGSRVAAGETQLISSGCDYWNRDWLERPADSVNGTYIPALDIQWAQAGKAGPWLFFRLHLDDLTQIPQGYKAGFEIDDNLDSRGDFLVLVLQPATTDWTTNGVQVWADKNGDVGGTKPFSIDTGKSDGYETQLFDSGVGSDPDLAWARINPKDTNEIEFAVKANLLTNQNVFGWWGWTGLDNLTPANMEVIDHDQDTQTWELDNVCSWIFGEKPKEGQLANLCPIIQPTPTPTTPPVSGSCPVKICRLGTFWNPSTCRCEFHFIIIPTNTPIIIY